MEDDPANSCPLPDFPRNRAPRATRDNVIQFLGAGSVNSYPDGTGEAAIHDNPAFLDPADGHWPLTSIGSYHPGQVAEFFYTIDQSSRTFRLVAGKGAQGNDQNNYLFPGPIKQLDLFLFLQNPSFGTAVFTNNVTVEEL
jgi:hypothetical protein